MTSVKLYGAIDVLTRSGRNALDPLIWTFCVWLWLQNSEVGKFSGRQNIDRGPHQRVKWLWSASKSRLPKVNTQRSRESSPRSTPRAMAMTTQFRVRGRPAHTAGPTYLSYTPDGTKLVTVGSNNTTRVYKTGYDGEPTNIDDCQEQNMGVAAAVCFSRHTN
jgi:WD40 repeat protein